MAEDFSYNLNEVMQAAIDHNLKNMFTCIPGVITSISLTKGTVDVKPSIKRILSSGDTIDLPTLKDVPLCLPMSNAGGLNIPLASGDGVLLLFSQRSIDSWKVGKTDAPPTSYRKFSISDAMAIPVIMPSILRKPQGKLYSNASMLTGKAVFVGNPIGVPVGTTKPLSTDVIAMLTEVLDILSKLLTPGGMIGNLGAPVTTPTIPPTTAVDLALYKTALSSLIFKPSGI